MTAESELPRTAVQIAGDLPQEARRKPSRDPRFVIVLLAVALGIAGVAVLFALFLW
ncbi:MAG: hypothetical protein JWO86_7243 [Myxococcaceae bacterium]|nr:hypothetical protein [Myxococcaceae bacterium]